ncbi:hypothetical protein [Geodermatophilus nigrescens]|uniref:Excreted virulence factor EspC, type VII ESX diderm n=1 Tax=Geodermatophilus nigrescens TaxID=1070870 RepID=A0A1M5DL38_9ACTN|nr:hypothetical protein [Geodermatophilus nigrescens]SHF67719.1 hypothetical protein SAMN05444351_0433 [Geodermatophilus nigrescens]
MSAPIAIQLDAVQELAEELALLASELSSEVGLCTSTAASLDVAAPGEVSESAGATGRAWAGLVDRLATGTGAVAGTLLAAVRSYRLADAALSDRVLAARAGRDGGA